MVAIVRRAGYVTSLGVDIFDAPRLFYPNALRKRHDAALRGARADGFEDSGNSEVLLYLKAQT